MNEDLTVYVYVPAHPFFRPLTINHILFLSLLKVNVRGLHSNDRLVQQTKGLLHVLRLNLKTWEGQGGRDRGTRSEGHRGSEGHEGMDGERGMGTNKRRKRHLPYMYVFSNRSHNRYMTVT